MGKKRRKSPFTGQHAPNEQLSTGFENARPNFLWADDPKAIVRRGESIEVTASQVAKCYLAIP
ncbi:MAG: hypothetical protein V3R99_14510, partial [Thermoguttaceae bacterium]